MKDETFQKYRNKLVEFQPPVGGPEKGRVLQVKDMYEHGIYLNVATTPGCVHSIPESRVIAVVEE